MNPFRNTLRRLGLRRAGLRAVRALKACWQAHRRLLETNPEYAAVLAALAAAVITQTELTELLADLAVGLLSLLGLRYRPAHH